MATMALPVQAKIHDVKMTAVETDVIIEGNGERYAAWTFNGQVPGPVTGAERNPSISPWTTRLRTKMLTRWISMQRRSIF